MDKYLVPLPSSSVETPKPPRRRLPWSRISPELDGRLPRDYRRNASRLLLDSYSEMGAFPHHYYIGTDCCPTHLARTINSATGGSHLPMQREGVSSLEFDSQGVYLASVTKSGCLTVHDFDSLYCSIYGPSSSISENTSKQVLHLSTSFQLDVVRWNPGNQDEVACASRQCNKILLYDIGYISSEPVEVLEKGRSRFSNIIDQGCNGLCDMTFTLHGKSRLLASDMEGCIHIWDRRLSNLPCFELISNSKAQLNSIQLDAEERVVFGASKNGLIYVWDLRGGRTSFAFQNPNEVYHPPMTSVKISTMLEKITSLKIQSNIVPKEIHSINIDPSCPYQLSFHISDGWSGVLNIDSLEVTHIHCPPPAWLDGIDVSVSFSDIRKPIWLPAFSVYAVPCSSQLGIHLLDFYPDITSSCHVDFCEESMNSINDDSKVASRNRLIPSTETVLACAVHPLTGTIVAGTKLSSLLVFSHDTSKDEAEKLDNQ